MRHQRAVDVLVLLLKLLDFEHRRLVVRVGTKEQLYASIADRRQVVLDHVGDHLRFMPAGDENGDAPFTTRERNSPPAIEAAAEVSPIGAANHPARAANR